MIDTEHHTAVSIRTLLLVTALALAPAACAADVSKLEPQGYVNDFAGVVDATSRAQLEHYLAQFEQATGVQVAVVTIPSLDGEPIEDFTNSLFRKWGVGAKGKNEGLMLLLAIRDRKSRIEAGYGLEPILPDGFDGSVLREMRPSMRENNFGQALLAGVAHIGDTVAAAKGVTIDRSLARRAPPSRRTRGGGLPWPVIVIGIIVLFGLLSRGGGGGGFLAGMLLGNILGGNSRNRDDGWGGGGFGGGDSGGGGFGGFGGGDSGGGGASSDW